MAWSVVRVLVKHWAAFKGKRLAWHEFVIWVQIIYLGLHEDLNTSTLVLHSGGQSTQIKYLSKSTDTYNKILLQ